MLYRTGTPNYSQLLSSLVHQYEITAQNPKQTIPQYIYRIRIHDTNATNTEHDFVYFIFNSWISSSFLFCWLLLCAKIYKQTIQECQIKIKFKIHMMLRMESLSQSNTILELSDYSRVLAHSRLLNTWFIEIFIKILNLLVLSVRTY